jgi:hypothetical protein
MENRILQNRTFYSEEPPWFHFFGVTGQSNWPVKLAHCKRIKMNLGGTLSDYRRGEIYTCKAKLRWALTKLEGGDLGMMEGVKLICRFGNRERW